MSLRLHSAPAATAPRADHVAQRKPLISNHKPNNQTRKTNEQTYRQHNSTAADEPLSRTGVEIRTWLADRLNLAEALVASELPQPSPKPCGKLISSEAQSLSRVASFTHFEDKSQRCSHEPLSSLELTQHQKPGLISFWAKVLLPYLITSEYSQPHQQPFLSLRESCGSYWGCPIP